MIAAPSRLQLALKGVRACERSDLQNLLLTEHMRAFKYKKSWERKEKHAEADMELVLDRVRGELIRDHAAV